MWSASLGLRATVLALLLLVGACGFRPLYGNQAGGEASEGLRATRVELIPDREGQRLRTQLEILLDSGGGGVPTRYSLDVALSSNIRDVAIREDETASRRNILTRAEFTLTRIEDGMLMTRGTARATNAYNIGRSDFATTVAQRDALERAIEQLGISIQTQLAIYFRNRVAS